MIRSCRSTPVPLNWRWLLHAAALALATTTVADESEWQVIESFLELDEAWHTQERKISNAKFADSQKRRLRKELGEHPDVVPAAGAARAIIESNGKRAPEAAEFLMAHTRGLSPTADTDIELGTATLARHTGPDWSLVDDFVGQRKGRLARLFSRKPSGPKAIAAARAIIDLGGAHPKTVHAAEFLLERGGTMRGGSMHNVLMGIETLSGIPDYDNWPRMLMVLDRVHSDAGEIDEFLNDMADGGNAPVVRATARYYAASRLARSINTAPNDQRDAHRARALRLAVGLSEGVADEEFVATAVVKGKSTTQTLADAERDILDRIRYSTVGGTASELVGRRLDGVEEKLGAYANQVVLVDFWATWCGPCIASLPKLRRLAAELADERFEILSISIDEDLQSVAEFQAKQPMPWAQWHVGVGSELARTWQVRNIPTYILIDVDGTVLAKGKLTDELVRRLREAVNDAHRDGPEAVAVEA